MWKCDVISKMPHWLRIILVICKWINKINSMYQYFLIVESNPFCYQICPRHIFHTGSVFGTCTSALANALHRAVFSAPHALSTNGVWCKSSSTLLFVSFFSSYFWTQEFLWLAKTWRCYFKLAVAVEIRISQGAKQALKNLLSLRGLHNCWDHDISCMPHRFWK